jgi:hypothetical protein
LESARPRGNLHVDKQGLTYPRKDGASLQGFDSFQDSKTSGCFWLYQTLAKAKYDFASPLPLFCGGLNAFAVALPSVIVPIWNVVLYPQGAGFWKHVELENVESFTFDAGLFPEDTSVEPLEPEPSAN